MRRHRLALFAAASLIGGLACNESNLGPRETRLAPGAGARAHVVPVTASADAPESYEFDIAPVGGTIALGDRFTVTIPASAVCDPSSSSYGVGHWDDDCTPTDRAINVHAKIWNRDGHVFLDFSPALRFAPSATVTLSTNVLVDVLAGRTDLAGDPGSLAGYALLYSPDGGNTRINEFTASADRSFVTHINLVTGVVWRRIKHFSGYITPYGEPCEPAYPDDPLCVWDPNSIVTEP